MRIVLAPDKFKGSLSAAEVRAALARGIRSTRPDAELVEVAVSDGGGGAVDALVGAGFAEVRLSAAGPLGAPGPARYARRGGTAVIELAEVCGLAQLPDGLEPMVSSSAGLGQVIAHALADGADHLIVGIGGSASTDGGAGALQALGAHVLDAEGRPLGPGGGGLLHVETVSFADVLPALWSARIEVAVDVTNPLLGSDGAAAVFGPQKGANAAQVEVLDYALGVWARQVARAVGRDEADAPGAGAGGGAAFGLLALGAELRSGADLILDLMEFEAALDGADLVVTGEGRVDAQTLSGKAPAVVARRAAARQVPVVAVAGEVAAGPAALSAAGFASTWALCELEPDRGQAMADAAALVEQIGAALLG